MDTLNLNKELVKKFIEQVWNAGNLDAIEQFWSQDYVNHIMPPNMQQGIDNLKLSHQMFLTAFSDVKLDIHDKIAEENKVVTRLTFKGKHTGEFMNVSASNKDIAMLVIRIDRIDNGKIVEHWASFDLNGLIERIKE